ncbi:hypothetical protein A0H81_11752 [Grifola frondosa]|uniref:Uncharacterized protein n=1 Tax=Grifola frondosa TaxID=5627 RepID=A0A1C7LUC2_GRIFR|nr:hypothetical protein A0H81_11752 [Grifola frondosa]
MSSVVVESISAATIAVKSSLAEIRGNFSASQSLSLETVAEPINANIYLSNNGDYTQPTYLRLNTGNSELNANISVYLPSNAKKHHNRSQNFVAHAETFNAPLSIRLVHDPESIPAAILLHAESNLGNAVVSVDRHFSGTFDVATMFAAAEVLYSNNTSLDNDSGNSSSQLDMMMNNILDSGDGDDDSDDSGTPSPSSNSSRCLEYDLISDSRMSGWIGTPPRPTPSGRHGLNGQGHIGVVSSLNSAQLVLEP